MVRIQVNALRTGPAELTAQLPLTATLSHQLPDANGWQVWVATLDRPVRFHVPANAYPGATGAVEFDASGPYLWVRAVAVASNGGLFAGMRQLPVHLAYVLEPDRVDNVDSPYLGAVGEAFVDDVTAAHAPAPQAGPDLTASRGPAWTEPAVGQESESPQPAPAAVHGRTSITVDDVEADLELWVSRLSVLASTAPDNIPEHLGDGQHGLGYVVGDGTAMYRGVGPDGQTHSKTTEDRQDLVYWIVDDLAADLTRQWALAAPAHQEEDPAATRALWLGRWHNLMAALSTEWGERTRATIEDGFL